MGGTVGGLSPRWRVVSLPLPHPGHALLPVSQLAAVYHILYIFFFYHFLSPHPSRDRSKSKLLFYICILLYYLLLLNPKSFQLHGTLSVFRAGWVTLAMHKPRGLLPVGALLLCAHDPAQMTGYRCPGTWLSCIWPSYLKVGRGHYRGPSAALCQHTYIHTYKYNHRAQRPKPFLANNTQSPICRLPTLDLYFLCTYTKQYKSIPSYHVIIFINNS